MPDEPLQLAGCRVWLLPSGRLPRFRISNTGPTPSHDDAIDSAWTELTSANPRLFNGPILAFHDFDSACELVTLRRDEFKRLAVRERAGTGVLQFGITGVLIAGGPPGARRVLMGLRSKATRAYGGMWELAPGGGVEPPADAGDVITDRDAEATLREEMEEELGGTIAHAFAVARAEPVALIEDPIMGSFDVAFRVQGPHTARNSIEPASWEYDALRWVETNDLAAFVAAERGRIIPPTLALLEALDLS